jgi:hypothetical protein
MHALPITVITVAIETRSMAITPKPMPNTHIILQDWILNCLHYCQVLYGSSSGKVSV